MNKNKQTKKLIKNKSEKKKKKRMILKKKKKKKKKFQVTKQIRTKTLMILNSENKGRKKWFEKY